MNIQKFLRLLLLAVLIMSLCISIVACMPVTPDTPTPDTPDTPGDTESPETPDEPKEPEDKEGEFVAFEQNDTENIIMTQDGDYAFRIVYDLAATTPEVRNQLLSIVNMFRQAGISISLIPDTAQDTAVDCEILVGDVSGREGCEYDGTTLGNKGYLVQTVGNKIIITGGSQAAILDAIRAFKFKTGLSDTNPDLENWTVKRNTYIISYEKYNITGITINGNALDEYQILIENPSNATQSIMRTLKDELYVNAGYVIPFASTESEGQKYIRLRESERDESRDGFMIYVEGDDLIIDSQFPDYSEELLDKFISQEIYYSRVGEIAFDSDYSFTKYLHTVYYSDFGAVGDGITDDFEAIKAAHERANLNNQKVKADEGKTYHMGAHAETVSIMTDTDWTGATFIIDDSKVEPNSAISKTNIFSIVPSRGAVKLTDIGPLKKFNKEKNEGSTNIGIALGYPALILIANDNVKQYIRFGANADDGAAQQEVILVDAEGNIDESTPLLWDYDTVTRATAYPIDETTLTVTGGLFHTIANQAPRYYTYYQRAIGITRSNVVMRGITHTIEGEGDSGAPYNGFVCISSAHNILFDSLVFTGHKTYKLLTDVNNSMGTYEIAANNSNALTWLNCTQTNDINDTSRWGVMGTNYCKNLTYDGCVLSRFDAHKGMYNTTIINSTLGHMGIQAIGSGDLIIENCTINANRVVNLRGDYGSTWEGQVLIKDVTLNNTGDASIFGGEWYDHYFGYTCYLPRLTIIENITLAKKTTITVFPSFNGNNIGSTTTNNPVVLPEKVIIRNNKNKYTFVISSNLTIANKVKRIDD